MRQWFFRPSATRRYGIEWWGFSDRYAMLKWSRFGYGWIATIGPLRVTRYLVSQPGSGITEGGVEK